MRVRAAKIRCASRQKHLLVRSAATGPGTAGDAQQQWHLWQVMIARTEIWVMTDLGHLLQLESLLLVRVCPAATRARAAACSGYGHGGIGVGVYLLRLQPASRNQPDSSPGSRSISVYPDAPPPPSSPPTCGDAASSAKPSATLFSPRNCADFRRSPAEEQAAERLAAERGRYFPQELLERKTRGWVLTFASK